jgi:hypothetical protein
MVHHLQLSTGARKPSTVWRSAGLVLSLGALLTTSVVLFAESPSAKSTPAAEPVRSASRDDGPREESFGPQTPPADPSPFPHGAPFPSDNRNAPPNPQEIPPVPQEIPLPPDRPRSREFDRMSPQRAPHHRPEIRHGHEEDAIPEPELIQRKLTVRYGNPAVARLLRSLTTEQGLQLFAEVSILIDSRHLKPST